MGFGAGKLDSGTEKLVPGRFPNFLCTPRRPGLPGEHSGWVWSAPRRVPRRGWVFDWILVGLGGFREPKIEVSARENRFSDRFRFFLRSLSTSLHEASRLGAPRPVCAPSRGGPLVPPRSRLPQAGWLHGIGDIFKDNDFRGECRLILADTNRLPVSTNFG